VRIWAVANQKGGVGKSTTVVALAGLLAEQGKRVLMLDLDPQGSLTGYFGHDPDRIEGTIFDLFNHQGGRIEELAVQLLRETSCPGLYLLPASTAQATLERRIANVRGMGLVITKTLKRLSQEFDYAILDNAPSLGLLMVNSLAASHRVLVPVQTDHLAIKGLERMVHTLQMIHKSQGIAIPHTILPTMFDRRTQAAAHGFRELLRLYDRAVYPYPIPIDTKFRGASLEGLVPSAYGGDTHGVRAYNQFLEYLHKEPVIQQERARIRALGLES